MQVSPLFLQLSLFVSVCASTKVLRVIAAAAWVKVRKEEMKKDCGTVFYLVQQFFTLVSLGVASCFMFSGGRPPETRAVTTAKQTAQRLKFGRKRNKSGAR